MYAQAQFIELGEHILEFCEFVNQYLKEYYFKVLVAILDRGELDLGQMIFEKDELSNKKLLQNKKALAGAYQRFTFKVLESGLKSLTAKTIDAYKRTFVCKAIVNGYFRVPAFRSIFLEAIENGDQRSEMNPDHPASSLSLEDLLNQSVSVGTDTETAKYFDWQAFCYDFIDPTEQQSNDKILESQLTSKSAKWADRIKHRGQVFFMVIQAWVRHVRKKLYLETAITWPDVPGYR